MTVASGAAKAGPYTGNDVTSSFSFSFKVFADADIRVVETVIATEAETDLVLNTNYTVTRNNDQDNNPGGSVTYKVGGVTTALPSTKKLTIVGDFDYEQPTDIPNGGAFFASVIENALDRQTLLTKQLKERVDRAALVPVSSSYTPEQLSADLITLAAIESDISAVAGIHTDVTTVAGVAANVTTVAGIAANVTTVAGISANVTSVAGNAANINTVAGDTASINTVAGNIANVSTVAGISGNVTTVATNNANVTTCATNIAAIIAAPTAAANAAASESAAAASAAAAAATLASALWRDVVFVTSASSPVAIAQSDNGKLYVADTTGGAITFNLPQIGSTTMPFSLGVKLEAGGSNVTINRSGTDTIDGATSKTLSVVGSGTQIVADTSPAPDVWTAIDFGQAGANYTDEVFTAGANFTAGSTTVLTLSQSYGAEQNIIVHFDAAFQGPDTYTLAGTTLTFSSAIPLGTSKVYVKGGSSMSIGVPSDGTVTTVKIADANVTTAKLAAGVVNGATTVTIDQAADYVLIADGSDSGNFKKALIPAAAGVPVGTVITSLTGNPDSSKYLYCDGSQVLRSSYSGLTNLPDAMTGTARTVTAAGWCKGVAGGTNIVLMYASTDICTKSNDSGATWGTAAIGSSGKVWNSVTWMGGSVNKFVATSASAANTTHAYSSDGSSWTTATTLASKNWTDVESNDAGTRAIAVCASDGTTYYTTNGTSFSAGGTLGSAGSADKLVYWMQTAGLFVVVENVSTNYWTSTDGASWTLRTTPFKSSTDTATYLRRFVCTTRDSLFAIDDNNGYGVMWKTTDGINWVKMPLALPIDTGQTGLPRIFRVGTTAFVLANGGGHWYYSKDDGVTLMRTNPALSAFSARPNTGGGYGGGCSISSTTFLLPYQDVSGSGKLMTVAIDPTKAQLPAGPAGTYIRYA